MDELDRFPLLYESYSKSSEVYVSGAEKVTRLLVVLYKMDGTAETERAEGKTYPVGTTIRVRTNLQWESSPGVWSAVAGKSINFYRKINTGAYSKVGAGTTDYNGILSLDFSLQGGKNTFYTEFVGDAEYKGCKKAAGAFGY